MSAIVCGKRSSSVFFYEESVHTPKRIRCPAAASSSSLSPPPSSSSFDYLKNSNTVDDRNAATAPLAHLVSLFPGMDPKILERVLEASGNDLDSAIKSLNDLHLESAGRNLGHAASSSDAEIGTSVQISGVDSHGHTNAHIAIPGTMCNDGGEEAASGNAANVGSLPRDGSEWVEVLVREMMNASDVDDARARASRVLDILEKSIMANARSAEANNLHQENAMLKEQVDILLRENSLLKQEVALQHERLKDSDERSQELQHLRQLVSEYQEKVSKLEVHNYTLAMHLKQAQQNSSIPGRFHPDVF